MRTLRSLWPVLAVSLLPTLNALGDDTQDEAEVPGTRPPAAERREEQRRQALERHREAPPESQVRDVVRTAAEWAEFVQALVDNASSGNLRIDVRSSSHSEADGAPSTSRSTEITIVGPDGVQRHFSLSGPGNVFAPGARQSRYRLGLVLEPLSERLRSHLKLGPGEGIAVSKVFEGSPAARAGLREHDILIAAGDVPVNDAADFAAMIEQAGTEPILLSLVREGEPLTLKVTPVVRDDGTRTQSDEDGIRGDQRRPGSGSQPSRTPRQRPRPDEAQRSAERTEGVLEIEIQSDGAGIDIKKGNADRPSNPRGKPADDGRNAAGSDQNERIERLRRQLEVLQKAIEDLKAEQE